MTASTNEAMNITAANHESSCVNEYGASNPCLRTLEFLAAIKRDSVINDDPLIRLSEIFEASSNDGVRNGGGMLSDSLFWS